MPVGSVVVWSGVPVVSVVSVLPAGVDVLPVDDVEADVVVGADDVEKKLVIDVSHDVVVWSGVPVVSVVSVLPAGVDVLPFGVVVGADDVVGTVVV